jgi:hypothetical protein
LATLIGEIEKIQKKYPLHIIFTEIPATKEISELFQKKLEINIYTLSDISEDTSNW